MGLEKQQTQWQVKFEVKEDVLFLPTCFPPSGTGAPKKKIEFIYYFLRPEKKYTFTLKINNFLPKHANLTK